MKVFIGVGHGGADPGAVANGLREKEMNLVMAKALRDELVRHGLTVKMSRERDENDTLADEIREAAAFDPDAAISIHNNAGGGRGFEAYVQSGIYRIMSKKIAENIEREVKGLGQISRGVKTRVVSTGADYYGFLREIKVPAVILEGVFVDSDDYKNADTVKEQQAFGAAYARGFLKAYGIEPKPQLLYKVQVGAFSNRENAHNLVLELEKKGYRAFVTEQEA